MCDFRHYAEDGPERPYLPVNLRHIGKKADGAVAVRRRRSVQADWTWEEEFLNDERAREGTRSWNNMIEEQQAKEGLNLDGYHFKWKQAKMMAAANERRDDIRLLPYWERVRVLFLELGGEYKENAR